MTEVANKGSHFFKSGTKREATYLKKGKFILLVLNCLDDIPAPGTYDVKYYDIATKVKKDDDDPELSPKKAAFNTSEARFTEIKKPEISIYFSSQFISLDEEDQLKTTNSKNLDLLIKERMRAKPSAAFASTVITFL